VVLSDALLRCLLPADTDPDVLEAVRHHHERWDGRGYPRGLAGIDVPLIGRIMIVADATSAMHMDRPYRKGLAPAQIIDELRRGAGTQFDPELVEPFIHAFIAHHHLAEAETVGEVVPDKVSEAA
jgi:HD-GYP domain-containing protein (c-di-GMP phosphodiesterase class II)